MNRSAAKTAYDIVNNDAGRQAMQDFRDRMYREWVESEDHGEREKLHSIAVGGETFWRIMSSYATKGRMEIDTEDRDAAIASVV